MGGVSDKISRAELRAGDHIYSWRGRALNLYAHHGIYAGDGMVIHFTQAAAGVSVSSHSDNPCPICGYHSGLDGVISSCIDCFLSGGELYLYRYGVSWAKYRRGISSRKASDPPETVLDRVESILRNGFLDYNILINNCENFAIYCKTGEGIGIPIGQAADILTTAVGLHGGMIGQTATILRFVEGLQGART
ncbi:protein LEAD-SENSITIVE 1-like [Cornus florida]|uniref:protein LEAD-SENSITIVE 1-like n=1 Tax=Cornus florida TaxID=4283 RepID=UPI00289914EB|nr:protein LEAD-SENSITIVE 1-like [Cornus florida]